MFECGMQFYMKQRFLWHYYFNLNIYILTPSTTESRQGFVLHPRRSPAALFGCNIHPPTRDVLEES